MARAKKKKSTAKKIGIGAAIAGVAAAGAYYFYGPKGKKHRKQTKSWTKKAKVEIASKAKKMREFNERAYHVVVDEVSKKYDKMKDIDSKDVARFVRDAKKEWKKVAKTVSKKAKKAAGSVRKTVRKSSKKVAKRTTRKKVVRKSPRKITRRKVTRRR